MHISEAAGNKCGMNQCAPQNEGKQNAANYHNIGWTWQLCMAASIVKRTDFLAF